MNANEILSVTCLIAVFSIWILAEIKWRRTPRIAITFLLVAISCYFTHQISMVLPRYESDLHAGCMDRLDDQLKSGNIEAARGALKIYNQKRKHGDGYTAASEMWIHLNANQK